MGTDKWNVRTRRVLLLGLGLPTIIGVGSLVYLRPWLPEYLKHQWPKAVPVAYETMTYEAFRQSPPDGFLHDDCTASISGTVQLAESDDVERLSVVLEGITTHGGHVYRRQPLVDDGSFRFAPLLGGYYRAVLWGKARRGTDTSYPASDYFAGIYLSPGETKHVEIGPLQNAVQLTLSLTDPSGLPVRQGWLRLQTYPNGMSMVHSDVYRYQVEVTDGGVVRVEDVLPGLYAVSAWCGQAGLMIHDRLDLRGKRGEVSAEYRLDKGVAMHGRVVDQAGVGVGDALVVVLRAESAAFPHIGRLSTGRGDRGDPGPGVVWAKSVADGGFTLHGLDNRSRYQLYVIATGYRGKRSEAFHPSVRGLTLPVTAQPPRPPRTAPSPTLPAQNPGANEQPFTPKITLDMEYVVRNTDGKPLANTLVQHNDAGFVRTDDEGRLKLAHSSRPPRSRISSHKLSVRIHEPGYIGTYNHDLMDRLETIDGALSGSHTVDVVQDPSPLILGRVVDTRGRPVQDADIAIRSRETEVAPIPRGRFSNRSFDQPLVDGSFVLEAKQPTDAAYLVFQKAGYSRQWFGPIQLREGNVVHGLELVVEESDDHEVQIRDRYGIPIVGGGVTVTSGVRTPHGSLIVQTAHIASDRYGIIRLESVAKGELVQRGYDERSASGGEPVILKGPRDGPIPVLDPVAYPEIALKAVDSKGKPASGIEVWVSDDPRNWRILEKAREFLLGPRRRMTSGGGGTRRAKSDQDGIVRFWFDPRARVKITMPKAPDRNGVRAKRVDDEHYSLGEMTAPLSPGT